MPEMNNLVELCLEAYNEYLEEHEGHAPDFLILGSNYISKFTSQLDSRFATKMRAATEYRVLQYMALHVLCSFEEPDCIAFAHNPYAAGEAN